MLENITSKNIVFAQLYLRSFGETQACEFDIKDHFIKSSNGKHLWKDHWHSIVVPKIRYYGTIWSLIYFSSVLDQNQHKILLIPTQPVHSIEYLCSVKIEITWLELLCKTIYFRRKIIIYISRKLKTWRFGIIMQNNSHILFPN